MTNTKEIEIVKLVCDKHGEIGEMAREYLGQAQIEHRDTDDCTANFLIIPVVAAIVETIDEKKLE